ncbi:MAG TPA: A24 family peptidase [Terriglobales bacterium]
MLMAHIGREEAWMGSVAVALVAGWTDWRSRRIPNWLTVPGMALGIALNSWAGGWQGCKASLLGAALGLALLLPLVLLRGLGAGDWKLVGALGAFLGPGRLLTVLAIAIVVNAVMALAMIIWKGRLLQTLRNLGRIVAAMFRFRSPGEQVSLDDPQAVKVPFGVAVAIGVLLYAATQLRTL